MTVEDARKRLSSLSIEPSDDNFFKYIRSGDREIVDLFLDAGYKTDACDNDRNAAVLVASQSGQKDIARLLLARGASPEPLLNRLSSKKDSWDKLTASSSVLGFISSLLIAAVGGYFTYSYNQRQIDLNRTQAEHDSVAKAQANQVSELQAVHEFIPMLTSKDEQTQGAALVAIRDLADPKVAADLSVKFPGAGVKFLKQEARSNIPITKQTAVKALTTIASAALGTDSEAASRALYSVFDSTKISVVKVTAIAHGDTVERGFLASGVVVTNSGFILTTGNIAQDPLPEKIFVTSWDGRKGAANLIKFDRSTNLALIQANDPKGLLPVQLSAQPIKTGTEVIGIGYAFGTEAESSYIGTISEIDPQTFVSLNLKFPTGSAGGPLLDVNGDVIGLMNASLNDYSQAIRGDFALKFLHTAGAM